MSNLSYKVRFNDQYRRFSLPYESSYYQLRKKIEEVFPGISKSFQLHYIDEENDQISVNSQTELDEAKRLSNQIIRLIISTQESKCQLQSQPQAQPRSTTKNEEPKPFWQNPLAQNSFVQMLVFAQPYLTNPTLLKTVLPHLLSEMNKNNFIPQEELARINQLGNQFLDYPFVQDFLTVKLPKILQKITGTTPPPPPPPPAVPTATEQIQEFVMPFLAMAQSFVQNMSQNINNQFTPASNKQDAPPTSTPMKANTEPKKPEVVKKEKTATPPVSQPLPKTSVKPTPVPSRPETKYITQLKQLLELGFTDTQFLMEMLIENKGDVSKVLEVLSD